MKPPKSVQVGPFKFNIKQDAFMQEYGTIEFDKQVIMLRKNLGHDVKSETLVHEILHAWFISAGIQHDVGTDKEEEMVRVLAPYILDTIRRNPELLTFLIGGDNGV